ncbi:sugar MFS transporter [Hymenobacter sp. BT186]|uniref:Sugar MFS transporter n=1 Tax=Hymenobacter telluris TaxID=2816474 RepID=A0A939JD55_9BACT|nr:sugar MFS transporter [Hymenobacter telluris]MBO0358002.1 sugar MFS transporter [Hymenobacter telluris]MBW3374029.1 sugar MFS transporter [Hymenobacter norwichensis]
MATPLPSSAPTNTAAPARSYALPMVAMTALFFLFGAVTNFNGVLMPYLKDVCQLTDFQSSLVPFAFFIAYFLMSLPAGWVIRRLGYQRGIVVGLVVMAAGALLFIPAANARAFALFLAGLGVLGAGITLLQVAANPYVSVLGPANRAASRVSIVGVANNLGGTLSPLIGGLLLFGSAAAIQTRLATLSAEQRLAEEAALVKSPYLGLAIFLVVLGGIFWLLRLPEIDSIPADETEEIASATTAGRHSALQFRHLVLGIGAIFLYVGVEVGLGDFLIRYGESQNITQLSSFTQALVRGLNAVTNYGLLLIGQTPVPVDTSTGFTKAIGAVLVSSYWFGSMIGRIVGIPLLSRFNDRRMLAGVCLAGVALVLASVLTRGEAALWLVVLCGLCNSIMWPVIFPLAIKGLGAFTKQGSSYLIMAIVGGAIIPLIMGWVATNGGGLRVAFILPALCYAYLLYYSLSGYRVR